MNKCCDNIQFTWERDGEDMVLVCGSCGAVWRPELEGDDGQGDYTRSNVDLSRVLVMFTGKLDERKTWTPARLRELLGDSVSLAARDQLEGWKTNAR